VARVEKNNVRGFDEIMVKYEIVEDNELWDSSFRLQLKTEGE